MAMVSNVTIYRKSHWPQVVCRKREKDKGQNNDYPYKVIEITPPPKSLGVRCFPSNLQCGESVTIEGRTYTISAVTHRYQLRKGKYEPSEKQLDANGGLISDEKIKSSLDTALWRMIAKYVWLVDDNGPRAKGNEFWSKAKTEHLKYEMQIAECRCIIPHYFEMI